MWVAVVILVALVALLVALKAITNASSQNSEADAVAGRASCSTCTGSSAKCEQECMMEAATRPIEYFDDEELDRYRGREADSYSENEAEDFAEVLHTMRQTEVAEWCRSLNLRGVNLPNQLKDEVIMLIEG